MSHELPDVQPGFRKGRGTRDQIANIHWIIEKAREFQKNIYFCFIDNAKALDCVDHNKLWKILKEMGIPEDGGGIGQGDHFLPHKLIKRTFERSEKLTKQLLNASRGHQAPRKAAHCLRKKVGKTIKDKKRDKSGRDGAPSWEGSLKKRGFQTQETLLLPSLWRALEPQRAT